MLKQSGMTALGILGVGIVIFLTIAGVAVAVTTYSNGTQVAAQPGINFVDGDSISWTLTNDPTNERVDVEPSIGSNLVASSISASGNLVLTPTARIVMGMPVIFQSRTIKGACQTTAITNGVAKQVLRLTTVNNEVGGYSVGINGLSSRAIATGTINRTGAGSWVWTRITETNTGNTLGVNSAVTEIYDGAYANNSGGDITDVTVTVAETDELISVGSVTITAPASAAYVFTAFWEVTYTGFTTSGVTVTCL